MSVYDYTTPKAEGAEGPTLPAGLSQWMDRREQAKRARQQYEPVWHLCRAFLANRQWVGWDKRTRRIIDEPNPGDRERHTVNVLTARVWTMAGKFVGDDMQPQVFGRLSDIESEMFAEHVQKAVEWCWEEELEAENEIFRATLAMLTYGTAAIQARYDPFHGGQVGERPLGPAGPIIRGEDARAHVAELAGRGETAQFAPLMEGRCSWDVLSPFNLFVPPGLTHEKVFPWLIVERPVHIDQVLALYPQASLSAQDISSIDLFGYGQYSDAEGADTPGRLQDHVLLSTGYEMPCPSYPQGRTFIWAQDQVLNEKPQLPYMIDGKPHLGIRFFKYHSIDGRFWAQGMVEPLIGPQRERNRSRSQYIEMKDRAGLGRVYARPNSMKIANKPTGKIMEVVEVPMGIDFPQETNGLGPGPWIENDVRMHDDDMNQVAGMWDVTMGQSPGTRTAYASMALLSEQDDRRVGTILKDMRKQIAWLTRYTINDMRLYWPAQKHIALAGDEGRLQEFVFKAAQLPESIYVKIGQGAPRPKSQAAEIQKIFDLFDRSVSSGQRLPLQWLFDSLNAGQALPLPTDYFNIQRRQAELENMLLLRGIPAMVQPMTDDHMVHITEHQAAKASMSLVPGSEMVVAMLDQHIQEHAFAQQQAATNAASAPELQGGRGQEGGDSPDQKPSGGGEQSGPPSEG